ncbi:aldehyde-activating protein, partial [Oleiphilus sp. HI0132]
MIKGTCLCEEVQYQYDADIQEVAMCHCHQCKKAQGTPFVTNAPIESQYFTITSGADHLKTFMSSPNKKRVFCSNCGSPLYSQRTDMPETIRLRLG